MTQLTVTMAFVVVLLLIILFVIYCATRLDYKKLLERIRKRSWEK